MKGKKLPCLIAKRVLKAGEFLIMSYGISYWRLYMFHYNLPANVRNVLEWVLSQGEDMKWW